MRFDVVATEPIEIERPAALRDMFMLSPFVWRDTTKFSLLLRMVPREEDSRLKISRVHFGTSSDGVRFTLTEHAVLAPGPDEEDRDGCEDPSIASLDGTAYVYYSGWNQSHERGELLLAAGPSPQQLTKRGVALPSTPDCANPKEATIVRAADGSWRLFFEYAEGGASRVGVASSASIDGPWTVGHPPFAARAGAFDSWHLSPGPIVVRERPVMFYNGADRDTRWRIGWIAFDENFRAVEERCEQPLIVPPPPHDGESDIAFVASAVEGEGEFALYYSLADQHLRRARVRAA